MRIYETRISDANIKTGIAVHTFALDETRPQRTLLSHKSVLRIASLTSYNPEVWVSFFQTSELNAKPIAKVFLRAELSASIPRADVPNVLRFLKRVDSSRRFLPSMNYIHDLSLEKANTVYLLLAIRNRKTEYLKTEIYRSSRCERSYTFSVVCYVQNFLNSWNSSTTKN